MPLFYFDIDEGDHHTPDQMGVELPNLAAARKEATILAGELLRDRPDDFWETQTWRMTVSDDGDRVLFTIEVAGHAASAEVLQLPTRRA